MGLTRKQLVMVAVLLSGSVLVVLNQTLLSPAFPKIMADLSVDATTVQWLTSGYSLVEAIIIPLSAYFLGRFRTRQLFIGGLIIFGIGSVVAALAPVFGFLLLGRVLQASACGIVMPMVFTLILLIFPREARGRAMGIVGLIMSFAPAVGPSLSGFLVDTVGWRFLFVIVSVLTVIVILVARFALKDFEPFDPASFDKPSVLLSSFGMLFLLYGFSTFTSSDNLVVTGVLVVAGIVLLAIFARRQLKLEVPLLRVDVFKSRNFRVAVLLMVFLQASLVGSGVVFPIYIQNVLGHSATVTGLIMLPGALLGALCGYFAGKLFDRFGHRVLVLLGGGVMAASGIGLLFFEIDSSLILVTIVYTCLALGIQFIVTPMNTWGINSLDNRVLQHGNALSNTIMQVGISFGTALIVSLTALAPLVDPVATGVQQIFIGNHIAFMAMGIMLCVVYLGIILFARNKLGVVEAPRMPLHSSRAEGKDAVLVSSTMNEKPAFVRDTATVREAVAVFAQTQTSGIPILSEEGALVGFISDGDVMRYLGDSDSAIGDMSHVYRIFDDEDIQHRAKTLLQLNVMRIATHKVISVDAAQSLSSACKVLSEKKLKKLPVLDNGTLVGTLSRRNVIQALNRAVDSHMLDE